MRFWGSREETHTQRRRTINKLDLLRVCFAVWAFTSCKYIDPPSLCVRCMHFAFTTYTVQYTGLYYSAFFPSFLLAVSSISVNMTSDVRKGSSLEDSFQSEYLYFFSRLKNDIGHVQLWEAKIVFKKVFLNSLLLVPTLPPPIRREMLANFLFKKAPLLVQYSRSSLTWHKSIKLLFFFLSWWSLWRTLNVWKESCSTITLLWEKRGGGRFCLNCAVRVQHKV